MSRFEPDPIYQLMADDTKAILFAGDVSNVLGAYRPSKIGHNEIQLRVILRMLIGEHEDNIYRVDIGPHIRVLVFGFENVDTDVQGMYYHLDELPQWMQEQIAKLSMMSVVPPTENVEGVGRRITANTYWVYKPHS